MVFRTRVIVRLGTQNRMVTKGYRKGVYDRVTTGTAANWKPPESWRPGAGVDTPIRYTRPSIPIRLSSEETVVRTGLTVIAHVTAKTGQEDLVHQALLDLVDQHAKRKVASTMTYTNLKRMPPSLRCTRIGTRLQTSIHTPSQLICRPSPGSRLTFWSGRPRSVNGLWFQNSRTTTHHAEVSQHSTQAIGNPGAFSETRQRLAFCGAALLQSLSVRAILFDEGQDGLVLTLHLLRV
jgi:hypothetical protein